jgi:hypothetical protein
MKKFPTIFLLNFVGGYVCLFAWFWVAFLASDDPNRAMHPTGLNMFVDHLVDFSNSAISVLSWGASTWSGLFLCGFPLSAALFALIVATIHSYWTYRKTKINNNAI